MFGILAKFFRFSGKENGNKCAGRFYIYNKKGSGYGENRKSFLQKKSYERRILFLRMVEIKK